jgi:hypothetical protein
VPVLDVPAYAIAPAAPTNLSMSSGTAQLLQGADGSIVSRLQVSWSRAIEANLQGYEIQFRRAGDSAYTSVMAERDALTAYLAPVEDGVLYDVRVRALAGPGARRSAWLTGTHTVVGKTQAPAAPTTLTVTPALGGFDIVWSSSGEVDYRHSLLYEATSNNFAAATVVATVSGNRAARAGLGAPVARWYWVRHVDTSGNQSARFPAGSGITATTLAPDGGGVPTVANAASITAAPGSSPPGGDDFWAVYDLATGKIWRWITASGAYSKAADGADLDAGSVAADRIAGTTVSSIRSSTGQLTIDAGGWLRMGQTDYNTGSGFWVGFTGGLYRLSIGSSTNGVTWDGSTLTVRGSTLTGDLQVDASGNIRGGQTAYNTGTGFWIGYSSGAYRMSLGNPAGAHVRWDGTALTIRGSVMTGDVQVDSSGNIRGGQTAWNTGSGFWIGYTAGGYRLSIGDPTGNYVTWDGSSLSVQGLIVDKRTHGAGSNVFASADFPLYIGNSGTTAGNLYKSIRVTRPGTITVYFELRAGGQSVAYGRIRVNGNVVGTLRTTPTGPSGQLGPVQAYTENITVAAGDLVQLYCSYSGINFGVCKNLKLKTNLTLSTDGVELDDGGFNYAWGA